tara:strand:+ start:2822 stop:3427 length:606 start_codon:yes stop_codon:yes gene_type:complete
MILKLINTSIPDVLLLEPNVYDDPRGFFLEIFHQTKYTDVGIDKTFVQDNYSHSKHGILRGLHYQLLHPQGKLIFVLSGEIFDVAVDIRRGSSTFGQWFGVNLSAENKRQIYVPEGFAHGFCVLSESADVMYKCSDFYDAEDEYGIFWSDETIAIDWPVKTPILSEKDSKFQILDEIPEKNLPIYGGTDETRTRNSSNLSP